MAARKPAQTPGQALDDILFPEYAPTIILLDDSPILVKFVKLTKGPENQYGIPFVMTVEAVEGTASDNAGTIIDLVPGNEYSFWLLHGVILDRMREGKPKPGERIAIKKTAKRTSKSSGNDYTPYSVVFVDRPQDANDEVSWDDV